MLRASLLTSNRITNSVLTLLQWKGALAFLISHFHRHLQTILNFIPREFLELQTDLLYSEAEYGLNIY